MSFIIKGIDLPKNGETLKLEIFDDGSIYQDKGTEWQGYPQGTAIQIPKGHGRLIDGDEPDEFNGCDNCKYDHVLMTAYPCSDCEHNHISHYEPKEAEDLSEE